MDTVLLNQLRAMAEQARNKAYAPYSGYKVGACVVTESGEFFTGCNIENSSYGLTLCAERLAVFNAVLSGKNCLDELRCLVIVTDDGGYPCGACLQVISEFTNSKNDFPIYLYNKTGDCKVLTLSQLLPQPFHKNQEENL